MATMIPSDIGEFETEGEKTFYKFLEGVAKPDAHYLCWYLPEVNGKEPDFLLYSDEVGLIIFEVKCQDPKIITKSGLMVGLGENRDEVMEVMRDLREAKCNLLTLLVNTYSLHRNTIRLLHSFRPRNFWIMNG